MNRFSIDLKDFTKNHPELSLKEQLALLGKAHKDEIFPQV
jgi:hypothetical protein